jgi:prepilin-type N-terminal cleavage/methylation domain-containing protein
MMSRSVKQPQQRQNREVQAGITLVELLVVMVILSVVTTMLIGGWISLQRASAFAVQTNNSRATARDALDRVSTELRDSQPPTLATPTPTPTPAPTSTPALSYPILTYARPMEAVFYSAYNQPGANEDGSGTGALKLTRIYLDTASGFTPQKTLYWQRKTDASTGWALGTYREVVLAKNVVNNSIPNSSYTPIFTYGYGVGGSLTWTDNSDGTLNLATITAVRLRLVVDANLAHTPTYIDLSTTVILRNAAGMN